MTLNWKVVIDCADPHAQAAFWAAALGYAVEDNSVLIDRLLNAVSASRVLPPGRGGVLIDAGSAVTVDWLDEEHVFRGGSIFPGLDLMAEAPA